MNYLVFCSTLFEYLYDLKTNDKKYFTWTAKASNAAKFKSFEDAKIAIKNVKKVHKNIEMQIILEDKATNSCSIFNYGGN